MPQDKYILISLNPEMLPGFIRHYCSLYSQNRQLERHLPLLNQDPLPVRMSKTGEYA